MSRAFLSLILAGAFIGAPLAPVFADDTVPAPADAVSRAPETVLVKFKDQSVDLDADSGKAAAEDVANDKGASVTDTLPDANIAVVTASSTDADALADQIAQDPRVEYAEPNYARRFDVINTNDTFRARLWALDNTGQTVNGVAGTNDADIDWPEALQMSYGTSTIVAVIDNGVLYTHPDLDGNLWDGANCVDDVGSPLDACNHGYDFADNDKSPLPQIPFPSLGEHGTHVAGIIAAEMNNGAGVIGVAPSAKIMALRFGLDVASEVRAIDFARQNGAKIINASYGGSEFSQAEYDAIARFRDAGGIFVAAAGNGGNDSIGDSNDSIPQYPASYDLSNIIAVAATDQNDALTSFSNYGATSVDIGAPGKNIYSTATTDGTTASYEYLNGTSMATPETAGVVALLMSLYPTASITDIKNAVLNGGDPDAALSGKTVSGRRLNAYGALNYLATPHDTTPPVISLTGDATITLTVGGTYTEPGATATDDTDGTVAVTIGGDTPNPNVVGTYHVTYDATDVAGNHATQVIRTVNVNEAPHSSGGGGGGGGGGSHRSGGGSVVNPVRTLFAPASPYANLTPEARLALLQQLLSLLAQLQARLAALQGR